MALLWDSCCNSHGNVAPASRAAPFPPRLWLHFGGAPSLLCLVYPQNANTSATKLGGRETSLGRDFCLRRALRLLVFLLLSALLAVGVPFFCPLLCFSFVDPASRPRSRRQVFSWARSDRFFVVPFLFPVGLAAHPELAQALNLEKPYGYFASFLFLLVASTLRAPGTA